MALRNNPAAIFRRAFKKSLTFFGKFFWGHEGGMFYIPFAPFQDKIFKLLTDSNDDIVVAITRGFGKTKLISVLYSVWTAYFNKEPYIMIVSYSREKTRQILRDIERLISDEKFKKVFGDWKSNSPSWSQDRKVLYCPEKGVYTILEGRGADQQILGASEGDSRLTLVILDDIMSPEQARSPDRTEKLLEKINEVIRPALASKDRRGLRGRMIHLGTPFAKGDYMSTAMSWSDVKVAKFPALDENNKSIWEAYMSTEELLKLQASYTLRGAKAAFDSQYLMNPEHQHTISFPKEKVKYITLAQSNKVLKNALGVYIFVDMAYTQKTYSDRVGIAVVGISSGAQICCLEAFRGKINQDELFDVLWVLEEKFRRANNYQGIFIETKQFQLTQAFFHYKGVQDGKPLNINPLRWKGEKGEESKVNRINALAPYLHVGNVSLVEGETTALEVEMFGYTGVNTHGLDTLDAFAYTTLFLTDDVEYVNSMNKVKYGKNMTVADHIKLFGNEEKKEPEYEGVLGNFRELYL